MCKNGKPSKATGKIDYVLGWYFKAAQHMKGTSIHTAFVSTNGQTDKSTFLNLRIAK